MTLMVYFKGVEFWHRTGKPLPQRLRFPLGLYPIITTIMIDTLTLACELTKAVATGITSLTMAILLFLG